jgi:preprotein translocase subunit YajC
MISQILLQADGGGLGSLLPLLLVIVVMYFFFFRPQMKKQKEERNFQKEIAKGMRVVTSSGIHGKILEVGDTFIILESENSRLKLEKSSINKQMSAMYLPKEEKKEKDDKKSDKK